MLDFTKKDMLEIEVKTPQEEIVLLGFEKTTSFELKMAQVSKELQMYMFQNLKGNKDLSKLAKVKDEDESRQLEVLSETDIDFSEFIQKQEENATRQLEVLKEYYRFEHAQNQWSGITQSQYEVVMQKLLELYNEPKK